MRKAVVLFVVALALAGASVGASVPPMINYQGKLMQPSGAAVPDRTYSMQFAIYDVPTGGTPLWSETNPSVQVKGGLFAVLLGSVTNLPANLFDSPDRWFGVKVGTDPEMTPRQQIASTAFAFKAAVAGTVDDGAISTSKLQDGAVSAAKLSGSAIMLGYSQTTADFSTTSAGPVQVPGLSVTVSIPPGGRKVKITVWCRSLLNTGANYAMMTLWDGPVGGGTKIGETVTGGSAYEEFPSSIIAIQTPGIGTKTYNVALQTIAGGGTAYLSTRPFAPALVLVEAM